MKVALLCLGALALTLSACTTLENRRDLYCGRGKVCGPYTCGKYKQKPPAPVVTAAAPDYKGVTK